jgi:hypothetical protein
MNGISLGPDTNPITAPPRGGLVGRYINTQPGRIVMNNNYNHDHQWQKVSCSEHPPVDTVEQQAAEDGQMGGFSQQQVSEMSGCDKEVDEDKGKVADILAKLVSRCQV